MSKIRTYKELQDLKLQLEADLIIKRQVIERDVVELKEEWKPITSLLSGMAKFTTPGKTNPLLGMGINLVGDVLLGKVLLSRSGWIAKLVVPFLVKNYSTHILNKQGTSIFQNLIDKWRSRSNGKLLK